MQNHAALAWDNDGSGAYLFMGHPAFNIDHSFYCGLAPGLDNLSAPDYVYRIIDVPTPSTPQLHGDVQFFHWVIVDNAAHDDRVGVNTLTPQAEMEIYSSNGVLFGNTLTRPSSFYLIS